jgi:pimeloyl-ACP methyl ester carboxylesterase
LPLDPERGLDDYVAQVVRALDDQHIDRAVICGVSFGGVVAIRFAAAHPDRTQALVLASTPAPTFHLKRRHEVYARWPRLLGPLFVAETPARLHAELAAAFPRIGARVRFAWLQLRTFAGAPISLARMGERGRILSTVDLTDDCRRIAAPTLIVTGEPGLDRVVPVEGSSEYLQLVAGARGVVLERTGHQGVLTRPDAFARVVRDFVDRDARLLRDRAAS